MIQAKFSSLALQMMKISSELILRIFELGRVPCTNVRLRATFAFQEGDGHQFLVQRIPVEIALPGP